MSVVGLSAGWSTLPGIASGFGQAQEFAGKGFPSWERLTVELVSLSAITVCLVLILLAAKAIRWNAVRSWFTCCTLALAGASALHLFMSLRVGWQIRQRGIPKLATPTQEFLGAALGNNSQLFIRSLHWLKNGVLWHLFPAILPACMILLVVARGGSERQRNAPSRNALLLLLGLCLVCRARRLFEYVEWYHFLLEIPVYLAVLALLLPEARAAVERCSRGILLVLLLVGGYSYWWLGTGAFTRQGRGQLVATPRGFLRLKGTQPKYYSELAGILNGIDPSGQRPLFAFGYNGGFNYFFKRKNPTPLTQGFRLSNFPAERVLLDLQTRTPGLILLDNSFILRPVSPSATFAFFRWETPMKPNPYLTFDRPLFERLAGGCKEVARVSREEIDTFTVYDCAR